MSCPEGARTQGLSMVLAALSSLARGHWHGASKGTSKGKSGAGRDKKEAGGQDPCATTCPCVQSGSRHSLRAAPCHPLCKCRWGEKWVQGAMQQLHLLFTKKVPTQKSTASGGISGQGNFSQWSPHAGLCTSGGPHGGERGNSGG